MGELSIYHWLVVLLIVLLLFGGRKIPELMRGIGEGIRAFREGARDKVSDPSKRGAEPR
jgi:sec-independent protein translocase protein TatA